MGLSQDIVIHSQFSSYLGYGRGTRGGTPGNYVLQYMARDSAPEYIAPTKLSDADPLLKRYDLMSDVASNANTVGDLKTGVRATVGKGGLAFCDGDASVSDEKIKRFSEEVQRRFESGKTVMELVVSFDEEYLRRNNVIDPDFFCEHKGDYKGNVDQLKLRLAIMHGVDRIKHNYDDLHYAGVIHVDTKHVHCHLAMVDFGIGTLANDGTQRGKISATNLKTFRRGIDLYLDAKQCVKRMTASLSYDKQNVYGYVKRMTNQAVIQQGFAQFVMACLPENKNWWTANSNRKEMRKANALVRDFVLEILQPQVGSPIPAYQAVRQDIVNYADARQDREGISEDERLQLIRNGEEQIVRNCMNSVYSVLKNVPQDQLVRPAPMMDLMSTDYESMAAQAINDPGMEFGLKLRSYSSRLQHHREEYHKFKDEYQAYEETPNKSADSEALGRYLAYERNYQQMLMVKYQYFLSFLPTADDMEDEFEEIMQEQEKLYKMERMDTDPTFHKMGAMAAERYGLNVYGISHGEFIKHAPNIWQRRLNVERTKYQSSVQKFKDHLHDYGFDFDGQHITRDKLYEFDDVKSLDLHHLGYDFPYDAQISKRNVDRFVEVANERYNLFQGAKEYLERTDQGASLSELDEHDVVRMKSLADRLQRGVSVVESKRAHEGKTRRGLTITLSKDYTMDMQDMVRETVENVRVFE